MEISPASRPIHPIAVRRAFGDDRDHPAVPGTIRNSRARTLLIALVNGGSLDVVIDDPAFAEALQRRDVCRRLGEAVVLLNARYGLIGLAIGPPELPTRLAVSCGVCRLANGGAVELHGRAPQPGWLLFRCQAAPLMFGATNAAPGSPDSVLSTCTEARA